MASKSLKRNVFVDGKWYGPAHGNADAVPADVASKIENPAAYEDDSDGAPVAEAKPAASSASKR